ncbi:MAG: glycosyltransferase family 9 protein, partial [Burkholderiales bacterium]
MKIDRLLIVRLGSLGDVVHALPAVTLLREAFPAAEIHWAIEERWKELVGGRDAMGRPLVNALHHLNTRAWRRALLSDETWREVLIRFRTLRQVHFDAAIDFQGLLKSAVVAAMSGARVRYGFDKPREQVATLFYTRRITASAAHIVDQNIELASALATNV